MPSPASSCAERTRPSRYRSPCLAQQLLPWLRGESPPTSQLGRSWRAAQTTTRQSRERTATKITIRLRPPSHAAGSSRRALAPSDADSDAPPPGVRSTIRELLSTDANDRHATAREL